MQLRGVQLVRVLGWAMGAASLLNLAQDIGRLAVYGKLKTWLDAWSRLVHHVGDLLFGWIDIAWINVSQDEHHVLVIAGILTLSAGRATFFWIQDARIEPPPVPDPDGGGTASEFQMAEFLARRMGVQVTDTEDFVRRGQESARIEARQAWKEYRAKVAGIEAARRALPLIVATYFGAPLLCALLFPGDYGLGWSATFVTLSAYFGLFVIDGPKVLDELLGIGAVFLVAIALNYSIFAPSDG